MSYEICPTCGKMTVSCPNCGEHITQLICSVVSQELNIEKHKCVNCNYEFEIKFLKKATQINGIVIP